MPSRIFRDGLESADFGKWTGTAVSAGDSLTVVKTKGFVHHGGYSGYAKTDGSAVPEWAYCRELITGRASLHCRMYIKYWDNGLVAAGNTATTYFCEFLGTQVVAYFGVRNVAGAIVWRVACRNGAAYVTLASALTLNNRQWYCVEGRWLEDAANGGVWLWVDGRLILSLTGYDTNDYGDATQVRCGLPETINLPVASQMAFDCVIINGVYIGLESPLRQLTRMGHSSVKTISVARSMQGLSLK